MKDLISKLTELEATAPKASKKKMLKEDSTTPPMNAETKPTRLKDIFETMVSGQPIPVVGKMGDTSQTGAGFLNMTDTSPAAQALGKAVGDLVGQKKLQIVVPNQPGGAKPGQPAPAGATGQQPAGQMQMKEKWDAETKVAPGEKGKYAGKDKAELTKAYNKLKASGPHKKGSPEFGKMRELAFAIRAKSDWGKVQEEQLDELSPEAYRNYIDKAVRSKAQASDDIGAYRGAMVKTSRGFSNIPGEKSPAAKAKADAAQQTHDKRYRGIDMAVRGLGKEEQIDEKLTKSMSAGDIISDFEKSKDPKFKGKSKEERKKQALGAYYSMHPEKTKKKKTDEADIPSTNGIDTMGAGLGAGRSQTTLEAKEPQVEVIDNAFNRENYKDLIGKKYPKSKAPAYARVKEISEGQLNELDPKTLKNYRAIAKGQLRDMASLEPSFGKNQDQSKDRENRKAKRLKGLNMADKKLQDTLEEAKPDFLDLDKDGNKKEPMKKAAADKKKQKVKESMNHRISAARLEGKSHGLRGHAHSGKRYEDLEELKAYHEGYKEGLDECYGMGVYEGLAGTAGGAIAGGMLGGPLGAVAGGLLGAAASKGGTPMFDENAPATPPATISGMDDDAMGEGLAGTAGGAIAGGMLGGPLGAVAGGLLGSQLGNKNESEMDEGNLFTGNLAKARASGKKMADLDGDGDMEKVKENAFAFEAWDRELQSLLNESEEVTEGLSVSVSKGQQNSPDSVTITAQDHEADELLKLVKSAGLGLFADEEPAQSMSIQPDHGEPHEIGTGGVDIDVVDGDDMLSLIKKMGGVEAAGANDYADEEDCSCKEETNEETCNECGMYEGMHEASCSMGTGKEMVDEVESEDQMEFEVSEDNAPDSETAEHNADEEAEAEEDAALAKAAQQDKTTTVNEGGDGGEASEEGPESKEGETDEEGETVSESFINLFKKLAFIAEESEAEKDDKAEKAGKKVAKDIEYDEGHKGKDDDKAEKAGKKVTKDIEYDDKKDAKEKVDEWANNAGPGKTVSDTTFEQDIDFMTKVIAGGLNKPKSTGQTTIPVIAGQEDRMHDNPQDWATLAGIKK